LLISFKQKFNDANYSFIFVALKTY